MRYSNDATRRGEKGYCMLMLLASEKLSGLSVGLSHYIIEICFTLI